MIAPRLTHLSRTIVSQQSFRLTKTWAAPRTRNHCKASESDGSAPAQRSTTKQSGKWRGWIPRGGASRYGLGRLLAFRGLGRRSRVPLQSHVATGEPNTTYSLVSFAWPDKLGFGDFTSTTNRPHVHCDRKRLGVTRNNQRVID